MGEIKSVKVDNWGVFFLQKLQNFFNKTDYCDLTLQFRDNSQLKVHRLVLSACTDYFNVLEQSCEVVDDAIIMPNGLQADVVVPIVNFMYTGTLEFELKMYNRLLRTAKDMNMTVLLKLLEAHRRTMEMHPPKVAGQSSPKPRRRAQAGTGTANSASNAGGRSLIQSNQGNKRLVIGANANTQQNRSVLASSAAVRSVPVKQIGSTTFTRVKIENEEQDAKSSMPTSGGYSLIKQIPQQPTSPFEQLRKGYNNNKRPAVTTFVSPPAKKPNLEDVKEFAEQQRMRKQIAAEYGDDDYDASNIMDDDTIHNDDDDDEMMASSGQNQASQTTAASSSAGVQTLTTSSQQTQVEDPPGTTTIIVKHEGPDKPPTIVVKDSANSKMNHAKIISEVLRQYPHLVKSNKNIKLKIMPNSGGQAQKIIVKKEAVEGDKQMQPPATKPVLVAKTSESQNQSAKTLASNIVSNRPKGIQQQQVEIAPSTKQQFSGLQTSVSKPSVASSSTNAQTAGAPPQKRRIDSKTMHALIALGAENTTGPWLCLRCGRNGHPISIPSYRGFRRHLINTHKEAIDPALCEHCGWRSAGKRELHFHMQMEHKIRTSLYIFPECQLCLQMCIDSDGLNQHLIDSHPDENKQQCIYCNKIFPEELQLYTHMKTFHKKQALEDGIIDYSDDENQTQMTLPPLPPMEYDQEMEELKESQEEKKVKILSDISLPVASSIVKTETFAEHRASATEEFLHDHEDNAETKFVAADGSEVILTAEQRKEILSQLNQEHDGSGIVMVLNESDQQQQYGNSEIQSDQGAISQDENSQATTATNEEREEEVEEHVTEEDDQHDDNQIYNEMKSLQSNLEDSNTQSEVEGKQEASPHEGEPDHEQEDMEAEMEHEEGTEHLEESKESMDNLEWAENLISEHDLADDTPETVKEAKENKKEEINEDNKSQDEISKKLKELTGDWSEDDDDDEDLLADLPAPETSPAKKTDTKADTPVAEDNEMDGQENKETKQLTKDNEESMEFEDHAELLASLQNTDKDDIPKQKELTETAKADCENIDEDDIDMALKSLHREDEEEKKEKSFEPEDQIDTSESEQKSDLAESNLPETIASDKMEVDKEEVSNEAIKKEEDGDEERPEEKLLKELETINEPEVTSSAMEVEEGKKDLIEQLLSEQVETMENTATETPEVSEGFKSETEKLKQDLETEVEDKKDQDQCEATEADEANLEDSKETKEEFLDNSKEEKASLSENTDMPSADSASSTSEAVAVKAIAEVPKTIGEVTEAAKEAADDNDEVATSSTKDENISTEDRVKSLISEWGDDDDDEDDNDADLTANL